MRRAEEKVICKPHPKQLEVLRRWRDALEGNNKVIAYELMNQVLDGKITNEAALELLDSIRNQFR